MTTCILIFILDETEQISNLKSSITIIKYKLILKKKIQLRGGGHWGGRAVLCYSYKFDSND